MTDLNKKVPPLLDYVVKMMLLEGIRCYVAGEIDALVWIQRRLQHLSARLRELQHRDK
jgi:hypothetical protein